MAKTTVKHQILQLLDEKGPTRYSEFIKATGKPDRTIYVALLDMQRLGWVEKKEEGVYEITDVGRKELDKVRFTALREELEKLEAEELRGKLSLMTLMEIDWGSFINVAKAVFKGIPFREYKIASKLLDGLEIYTSRLHGEDAEILMKNLLAALVHYISNNPEEEIEIRIKFRPPKQQH